MKEKLPVEAEKQFCPVGSDSFISKYTVGFGQRVGLRGLPVIKSVDNPCCRYFLG